MHDRIIFISHEKSDIKLNTAFLSPYDIGMAGIADYIGEKPADNLNINAEENSKFADILEQLKGE